MYTNIFGTRNRIIMWPFYMNNIQIYSYNYILVSTKTVRFSFNSFIFFVTFHAILHYSISFVFWTVCFPVVSNVHLHSMSLLEMLPGRSKKKNVYVLGEVGQGKAVWGEKKAEGGRLLRERKTGFKWEGEWMLHLLAFSTITIP